MKTDLVPKPVIALQLNGKKLEYYNDLLIKADTGLHEQLFFIVQENFQNKKDIAILDISAGEGALSFRLYNHGYKNIEAVDSNSKDFKFKDSISFFEINLNDTRSVDLFAQKNAGKYDLILGIETIEHLENPWQYLRLLKDLLKDDGLIIVSTPNVNSIYSKVTFLFLDYFFQFNPSSLEYWHINPISTFEMKTICDTIGLKIETVVPGGTYPIIWLTRNPVFSVMYSVCNIVLFPFARGMKYGWCNIYLIKSKVDS